MLRIKKIDHVAVCVADLDAAADRWQKLLGIVPGARETVGSQKVEAVSFVQVRQVRPVSSSSHLVERVASAAFWKSAGPLPCTTLPSKWRTSRKH